MLHSTKKTKELISDVYNSPNLNQFFRLFSNNNNFKRLLFLHHLDLFSLEGELGLPYLHLCDLPKKTLKSHKEEGSKALQQLIVSSSTDLDNMNLYLQNIFNISGKELNSFQGRIKDIVSYFLVLFIRKNPKFIRLIENDEFNFTIMKSILQDYQEIIDFDNIIELNEIDVPSINTNKEVVDPVIIEMIKSMGIQIVKGMIRNIEGIMVKTKDIVSSMFIPFHLTSRLWLNSILNKSGLSLEEYISVLDELHRFQLIESKNMMSWCENCNLENPLITQRTGRIAPSKLAKDKCLNCLKNKSYASIFSFTDPLRDSLLTKDGILAVYFGWLLQIEGIDFKVDYYSKKYESDFVIKDSFLVECKMFRSQKDNISISSNLGNSLAKISKQIEDLKSKGIKIKKCYLLWNQWNDIKPLLKKFESKYNSLFEKYDFEMIYPDKIEEVVATIK